MSVSIRRISDTTAKATNLNATDLVLIAEVDGGSPSGYITKHVTGQEIINAISTPSIGLYAQTVQSSTITNTTTETTIVGSGVGSLSVPANTFAVGDSYHAKIGGVMSAQNGDDITINIKSNGTTLASTGLISLSPITALGWECELDFTIATIGGNGSICTNGNFAYTRNTGGLEGYVFQDVQVLNTTVANTLDITVTWGQAKTQDEIYSANFVLHKVY